jgi:hypothetical protein
MAQGWFAKIFYELSDVDNDNRYILVAKNSDHDVIDGIFWILLVKFKLTLIMRRLLIKGHGFALIPHWCSLVACSIFI